MKAWCRWCRRRIQWYPSWGAWGTIDPLKLKLYCPSREIFDHRYLRYVDNVRNLHEPVPVKPPR